MDYEREWNDLKRWLENEIGYLNETAHATRDVEKTRINTYRNCLARMKEVE